MAFQHERIFVDAAGRVRRVASVAAGHPSLLGRLGLALVIGLGFLLTLVVLVPAIIIGLIVLGGFLLWQRARRVFSRAGKPNGVLDGRRNVRVIERRE
jgi:hypothetical protein